MEFLEFTFSRNGTCKILSDTTLALARSSPTRRYTGKYCAQLLFVEFWLAMTVDPEVVYHLPFYR